MRLKILLRFSGGKLQKPDILLALAVNNYYNNTVLTVLRFRRGAQYLLLCAPGTEK